MKKRLIAILLSLAMVTSTATGTSAFAADDTLAETDFSLPEDSEDSLYTEGNESEDLVSEEETEEDTVGEADVFSDESLIYRKVSDSEVVVAGVEAEELSVVNIPSEVINDENYYVVVGVEKDALSGVNAETLMIPSTVTEFGGQSLTSLKNIIVSDENASLFTEDGVLFAKTDVEDKNRLVLYPAAKEGESYVVPEKTAIIGEEAFANVIALKILILKDGIEKIESYAVKTAANPMEIAFASYTAPAEIGESAFYLDGAIGNTFYFRSEEDYQAVAEIQPSFADSSAMYDENGELIEDTSSVISIVTDGIPEKIEEIINSESGEEKDFQEEAVIADKEPEKDDEKLPEDSSTTDDLKDVSVAEEALVGADPKELDANIASGYYAIKNQTSGKYLKIRNASISESTDTYLAAFAIDMGATFSLIPLGDGSYKIVAACSNKALTLSAAAADGISVIQKSYTGAKNQLWYIREDSSGTYKIYSAENDAYVLDTKGQGTASGTAIILSKSGSAKTQSWSFVAKTNPTADHLENGTYSISSALSSNKVLDIAAASTASGANVQIYDSNNTAAQKFILRYLGYGNLYRVVNCASNKALDTKDHKTGNGTNVLQATQSNSASTQIWRIIKYSDGKYIFFNAGANRVLDVANASTSNGANVQIYQWNNTAAQKWNISKVSGTDPVDVSGKDAEIKEGWYTMSTALTTRKIAVRDSSIADNANVLIQAPNLGERVYFHVEPVGNGKYEIRAFCSNKLLTNVWGADSTDAGNVVQKEDSSLSTQRWYIRVSKKNNKYVSIVSTSDPNYVLTLKGNKSAYGTSVTTALSTGLSGQRWKFTPISDPNLVVLPYDKCTYKIQSASNASIVVSTEAQKKNSQANVQLMKKVNGGGEFWKFTRVGYGNLYTITNAYTGVALDAKNGGTGNGTNVWQYTANGSNAQLWRVMPTDSSKSKFVIINAASGKVLDAEAGNIDIGTNIQLYTQNNTDAQYWTLSKTNINTYIPVNTAVTLKQKGNTNRLVEVKDGSTTNGATVQVYAERGNTDQSFILIRKDASIYKIKNAASNKYLDIKGTGEKAEVISTAATNSDSQLWKIMPTGDNDASFYICNMKTGYALTSAYANNTKVITRTYTKAFVQKFYFDTPDIKTGWQQVGSNWRYYDNKGNAYRDAFLEDGKYYFDKSGNLLTGWKKYGAYYYYFRGKDGREYTDNRPYIGTLYGSVGSKYNSQSRPNCPYYFTIDTARCVVTWYTKYPGTNDFNVPVVAFLCSPGTDSTPTDAGERKTGYIQRWIPLMGPSYGQYGTECKAWTIRPGTGQYDHVNTGEYFHSIACGSANDHNLNPNTYNLLGTKQSHGCIRLGVRNAYWVFNFVDAGTLGVCRTNLAAPLRTLPQAWAITNIDPTDPNYTGNWGYVDNYATAYTNGAYIPRG